MKPAPILERALQGAMPPAVPADRGVLRFITCGSVDDGKSTLIGRMLFDTKALLSDTLGNLERLAERRGDDALDLSLLTDGLVAEREQGITIDVAYRYFATARRKFIIADSPGHEQYTRNMVTAASTADVAVLLVDARKGILPQTMRHAAWSTTISAASTPSQPSSRPGTRSTRLPRRRSVTCRCRRSTAQWWSIEVRGCRGMTARR